MAATKHCSKCMEDKPLHAFHIQASGPKGRRSRCRVCIADDQRERYDSEKQRWVVVKSRYGITRDEYYQLYASQNGRCAICRRDESAISRGTFFCIDHDHKGGQVRGLLCTECNLAVGYLESTGASVASVSAYLERG